ncbi:hypothetical protein [Streptomyces noursei]|uniref:hypothetical protein n=1 Tax=Streptomyces noursei TaxID=1971 RepID=UPI00099D9182|nr:hypothetical protein [Streptomyces noursei]
MPTTPPTAHRTRFFDHRIPALYVGRYTIHAKQSVNGLNIEDAFPDRAQRFDVRGPRFVIPATDVHASYPRPGSTGLYSQVLPHLTFESPGVPWLRQLKGQDPAVPWMALLVFRENELPEDPLALGNTEACTATELLDGQLPGTPPAIDPEHLFDDEREMLCATVLVPGDLFTALAPLPEEMGMLAHIREGGPPDATLGIASAPDEDELKAVVVANRFPDAAGGRHVVHLLSFDGFEGHLGGTAAPPQGLRMVSLWSWAFETEPDTGMGFGDLAQQLAAQPDLLLRLPVPAPPQNPSAAQQAALERLSIGATALPQRLETGERGFGFYRGPLTAAPAQPVPAPSSGERLESAGEALAYVQPYGVFDASYAAAFSLGRTLALADAEFRTALLAFRKAARGAVRRLLTHPELVGRAVSPATAGLLLREHPARDAFDRLLDGSSGTARLASALAGAGADLTAGRVRGQARHRRTGSGAALTAAGVRSALAEAQVADVLRQATARELEPVSAWLARLPLLEMMPFEHLVPDPRMLPPESLRFFHVDAAWVRAAVDGALSVGVGHAVDADLNALARRVPRPAPCGLLLRSDLVWNWPKTVMTGFRGDRPVEEIHRASYGSDVLLLLFSEVIDTFTLAEPPQGLHFGFSDIGTIELRKLSGPDIGYPMGEFPENPGDDRFGRFLRGDGYDVLNVAGPGDPLLPALARAHGVPALSSAQLTLQMIKAPQVQTFTRP